MPEKRIIPYKVAKGNRPKIEEVIDYCLDGDLKNAALDFAAFMRDSKMPFKIYSSTTRFQIAMFNKNLICFIRIYRPGDLDHIKNAKVEDWIPSDTPPFWEVLPCLQHMDDYGDIIKKEELANIPWSEVRNCTCVNQHGEKDNDNCWMKGKDMTVLNENYKDICMWRGLTMRNPNKSTVAKIKRLLLLEKQARDIT